ncbi:MAG: acetyl-CoA acetyltransferase [Sulfitobacter sp.]
MADLAAKQGMDQLVLKVANGGDYVRLVQQDPPLFFKFKADPSDSLDRADLNDFKRLTLSEEDCSNGPKATLDLIKMLLVKFADYQPKR